MTAGKTRKSLDKIHDDTEFYGHQLDGIRTLARMGSFLLCDEMGLGKSLQALTVAAIDFQQGYASRILIVCPASLKWNWQDECEKHTSFSSVILDGNKAARNKQMQLFDIMNLDVMIVNYEQVVAHIDDLNKLHFDIIIYDEAHYIKNYKSKRTKACLKLRAGRHFVLTGSPLLNQVNELWPLLHRVSPSEFPKYWTFVNRYCNTPEAPVWMADGTFKPIGEIEVGDLVMGWGEQDGRRSRAISLVKNVQRRIAPEIIEVTMESGNVIRCTPDHLWLAKKNTNSAHDGWSTVRVGQDVFAPIVRNGPGRGMASLSKMIDVPRELSVDEQRQLDWLMGIYDGEGSNDSISQSKSYNPEIHAKIGEVLDTLGIPYREDDKGYQLKGGMHTFTALLHWNRFFIKRDYFLKRLLFGLRRGNDYHAQANRTVDRIMDVKYIGPGEVVSMETSTGNYVVWGYASKNCVYGGYQNKQIIGVKNRPELNSAIERLMVRRLKKDVLDLPDKQYIPMYVELSPLQRELYDAAYDDLSIELPDGASPIEIENALTKYLYLKKICGTAAEIEGYKDESAKLDMAMELIAEITHDEPDSPGEPVVVFTQFRITQACLAERINKAGLTCFILNGDVPMDQRAEIIKQWSSFKDEKGRPGILCGMLQVASVGLNMTAASKAIFVDRLYVPKLNEQAEDRIHRIGADSTKPVQIYTIIARKTIEQRIETILRRKSKLFNTLIEPSDWKKALYEALTKEEDD